MTSRSTDIPSLSKLPKDEQDTFVPERENLHTTFSNFPFFVITLLSCTSKRASGTWSTNLLRVTFMLFSPTR